MLDHRGPFRLLVTPVVAVVLAVIFGFSFPSIAQQSVAVDPYMAVLRTDPKTIVPGETATLDFFVMDAALMAPGDGLNISAHLLMATMPGKGLDQPSVTPGSEPGHYLIRVTFPHAEEYTLDLNVKSPAGGSAILSFKVTPGRGGEGVSTSFEHGSQEMAGMQMKATLGNWSTNREGSGTSWQPDSSRMSMKMLPSLGGFDFSTMGIIQGGYVDDGGKRGDKGLFSNSMLMLTGRRELGGGTLGLHFMTALDPFINGKDGVPNLFQNGFDVHGVAVGDRLRANVIASLVESGPR